MSIFTNATARLRLRLAFAAIAGLILLAGCRDSDKPKKDNDKDERSPQEKVVILKQRFDQLESSLHEMKHDLEIQKKRIESTQKIADSIKHSLMKGGLKGYSLGNISTTDPLVIAALTKQQSKNHDKETREAEKKEADDTILNALLIACFLVFIIAIFVAALKDKKTQEPLEPTIWPDSSDSEPEPPSAFPTEPVGGGINDTGSYEYGELRPPQPREGETPGPEEKPEDRPQ